MGARLARRSRFCFAVRTLPAGLPATRAAPHRSANGGPGPAVWSRRTTPAPGQARLPMTSPWLRPGVVHQVLRTRPPGARPPVPKNATLLVRTRVSRQRSGLRMRGEMMARQRVPLPWAIQEAARNPVRLRAGRSAFSAAQAPTGNVVGGHLARGASRRRGGPGAWASGAYRCRQALDGGPVARPSGHATRHVTGPDPCRRPKIDRDSQP